jgi:serine protease inhibitor
LSPAIIRRALLMAAAAADDGTRSAIASAFGLPEGAHKARNRIDHRIASTKCDQVMVTIADRIWSRRGIESDQA